MKLFIQDWFIFINKYKNIYIKNEKYIHIYYI